ncbi:MAG: UvrD-helicase domain-containing protein [Bacteroidales bacterium]|nr:UvrD-helicase domain-containing protein [Bacteroidales bacterium]
MRDLNDEQRSAVECTEGPVLIVAGAGSGKTRVLTSRIALLLERGCEPERILALTFTKKAAGEMKERIASVVGGRKAWRLCMGTFHSVFVRFLREFASSIGYRADFTIYDKGDSESAIKACIRELALDDKTYKPRDVASRISLAKNNLVTAQAYAANDNAVQEDIRRKRPAIKDIYALYEKKCKQSSVMDFDDILLNMNILLRDDPMALLSIAGRFSYILVDEYQDTNFAQYLILRKLADSHRNICVVGDDSQSIYSFRGARIENILKFRSDFKDAKVFRLEKNYRSTKSIVKAANSVIAKNSRRIPKVCVSVGESGEKIRLIHAWTEMEEGLLIASSIISRMESDHCTYEDFAILYRTNSQSRALEECLRKRNLPYRIYSGRSFFDRAEVKDMMAYLKLAVNPDDDESFKRAVNMPPRGIGETSMSALASAAREKETSLFKAAYADDLENYGLKNAAQTRIRAFCELISRAAASAVAGDAFEVATSLSDESGLYRYYKQDDSLESQTRAANIEELMNGIASFKEERQEEYESESEEGTGEPVMPVITLQEFLEDSSLLSNADIADGDESDNRISMMTIHSAKGLEFPYVYIAGMEENLFPNMMMSSGGNDLEEERRLFYVAITRAEKAVSLSYSETRMRNGKHEENRPSRFISEIDPEFIANPLRSSGPGLLGGISLPGRTSVFGKPLATDTPSRPSVSGTASQPIRKNPLPPPVDADFIPLPMTAFKAGQRVEHNRFGLGTVKEVTGEAPDLKARVNFDRYGEKLLMLKFAKMRFPKDS